MRAVRVTTALGMVGLQLFILAAHPWLVLVGLVPWGGPFAGAAPWVLLEVAASPWEEAFLAGTDPLGVKGRASRRGDGGARPWHRPAASGRL